MSIERPGLHDAFVAIAGEAAAAAMARPETGRMMRFIRSAWVIARRDFTATVLSKTFLFFLLGPLFPLLFGGVFGGIGAQRRQRSAKSRWSQSSPSPADFAPAVSGARSAGRDD